MLRLIHERPPEPRIGGQGPQGHVDNHGREAVQRRGEERLLIPMRMLVGLDADLQIPPPRQAGHAHAVVVDELQLPVGSDHHIGVLQITVGDFGRFQFGDQIQPPRGGHAQRLAVVFPAAGADPLEERLPVDPVHHDQRIPVLIAGSPNAGVAVFEIHQASDTALLKVLADCVVTLSPLRRFRREDANGQRAASLRGDPLVHDRERARPRPRLAEIVPLDGVLLERRIAECEFRLLQHRAELRRKGPAHVGRSSLQNFVTVHLQQP